jgi:hypothetical protein
MDIDIDKKKIVVIKLYLPGFILTGVTFCHTNFLELNVKPGYLHFPVKPNVAEITHITPSYKPKGPGDGAR